MKILKQNGPDCIITALAMVLDEDVSTLKKEMPFDSLLEWWTEEEVPNTLLRRRGYHIQEIVDCCLRRGYALCPIEINPRMAPQGYDHLWKFMDERDLLAKRFINIILHHKGIMNGETKSKLPHTVAWNGTMIHDPADGKVKDISEFRLRDCWILTSLLESNHSKK